MGKKILVVDDEEDIRLVVKDVLETVDFNVDTVPSGSEALKELKNKKFDLVLIDFFMPEMSGRELLKKIKDDDDIKDTKCAFLTVATMPERGLEKLKEMGILDYIRKPFDNDDLIKRVEKMINE